MDSRIGPLEFEFVKAGYKFSNSSNNNKCINYLKNIKKLVINNCVN